MRSLRTGGVDPLREEPDLDASMVELVSNILVVDLHSGSLALCGATDPEQMIEGDAVGGSGFRIERIIGIDPGTYTAFPCAT